MNIKMSYTFGVAYFHVVVFNVYGTGRNKRDWSCDVLCRSEFCSYEYKITWLKVFVTCFTVNALD
jgi:hypothetical protein